MTILRSKYGPFLRYRKGKKSLHDYTVFEIALTTVLHWRARADAVRRDAARDDVLARCITQTLDPRRKTEARRPRAVHPQRYAKKNMYTQRTGQHPKRSINVYTDPGWDSYFGGEGAFCTTFSAANPGCSWIISLRFFLFPYFLLGVLYCRLLHKQRHPQHQHAPAEHALIVRCIYALPNYQASHKKEAHKKKTV